MPDPTLCKVCKMPGVDGCRNLLEYPAGGILLRYEGEDLVSVPCPNMRVVAMRQRFLGIDPQLLTVEHEASTPLFQFGKADRTVDNLFFENIPWKGFLRHFKWVLANKPVMFVRLVTDMTLVNVYLGKASVQSRLKEQREEGDLLVSNSLEDLLTPPDLVVIRLGNLIHFNKAAANILREALALRQGLGKGTWLVEPLAPSFTPWSSDGVGMPCCDAEVLQLVNSTFERLKFEEPSEPPTYVESNGEVTVAGSSSEVEDSEPQSEPESEPQSDDSAEDQAFFAATTKRNPKKKGWH